MKKYLILLLLGVGISVYPQTLIVTNIYYQAGQFRKTFQKVKVNWDSPDAVDYFKVYVFIGDDQTHYKVKPDYIFLAKRSLQQIYMPKVGWAKLYVTAVRDGIESGPSEAVEFLDGHPIKENN